MRHGGILEIEAHMFLDCSTRMVRASALQHPERCARKNVGKCLGTRGASSCELDARRELLVSPGNRRIGQSDGRVRSNSAGGPIGTRKNIDRHRFRVIEVLLDLELSAEYLSDELPDKFVPLRYRFFWHLLTAHGRGRFYLRQHGSNWFRVSRAGTENHSTPA